MYGDSSNASHNELDILNASTTTNPVTAVASLTGPPQDCVGLSIAPSTTVGIETEKRTNILHVNQPFRTAVPCLTPLRTDMPNTGPSARTSLLNKRTVPMTQRTLRYLRREQRREVEEKYFSRLIGSNCVRSPDPGSIPYTHHVDEISPAQKRPSEHAPELHTDCYDQYSVRHMPFPREPPSPIAHPRTAPVTRRTLRYLRRAQRHEIEEKKGFPPDRLKAYIIHEFRPCPPYESIHSQKTISRHNANI